MEGVQGCGGGRGVEVGGCLRGEGEVDGEGGVDGKGSLSGIWKILVHC